MDNIFKRKLNESLPVYDIDAEEYVYNCGVRELAYNVDRDGRITINDSELEVLVDYAIEYGNEEQSREIAEKVRKVIENARYYREDRYSRPEIQLSDRHTVWDVDVPEGIDDGDFEAIYEMCLQTSFNNFYADTGVELYALGRSGRHICVDNTYENALNYNELRECQAVAEADFVRNVNSELRDLAGDTAGDDITTEELHDQCEALGKWKIKKDEKPEHRLVCPYCKDEFSMVDVESDSCLVRDVGHHDLCVCDNCGLEVFAEPRHDGTIKWVKQVDESKRRTEKNEKLTEASSWHPFNGSVRNNPHKKLSSDRPKISANKAREIASTAGQFHLPAHTPGEETFKMSVYAYNIEYDIIPEDIEGDESVEEIKSALPKELDLWIEPENLLKKKNRVVEKISDAIEEETGYLVQDFDYKILGSYYRSKYVDENESLKESRRSNKRQSLKEAVGKLDDLVPQVVKVLQRDKKGIENYASVLVNNKDKLKHPYKDFTTRFMWDIFWFLRDNGDLSRDATGDANDAHISTMLKKAFRQAGISTNEADYVDDSIGRKNESLKEASFDYMDSSERQWGKDHGLRKTNLHTVGSRGRSKRNVYRANDGRLFYRDTNSWTGTFRNYCYPDGQPYLVAELKDAPYGEEDKLIAEFARGDWDNMMGNIDTARSFSVDERKARKELDAVLKDNPFGYTVDDFNLRKVSINEVGSLAYV